MKRNLSIEFIKLFFAISIALGHFSSALIESQKVVMLFFALSGYFLVCSFDSGKYSNPWRYSLGRLKRIYPYYIFAFLILFFAHNIKSLIHPIQFFSNLFTKLPEILLLQNIGIFDGGINYPLWQLCTLIVASHILFSLLCWNRQLTLNVFCPVLAICVFTYLSNAYGSDTPNTWGVEAGFFYVPLLRAAGGISIGMFAHYPIKKLLHRMESSTNPRLPLLVNLLSIVAIVVLWVNRSSYIIVVPFLLLVVCMLYSKSIYAKLFRLPIFARMDKLSLALYLNHSLIIGIFKTIYQSYALEFVKSEIFYLLVLLAYSICMLLFVDLLTSLSRKLFRNRKNTALHRS